MLDNNNKPLISPINFQPHLFPVSTKNHFNINMDTMMLQNSGETPTNLGGFNIFRNEMRNINYLDNLSNQTKEINMQNKILINEVDISNSTNIYDSTPKYKSNFEEGIFDNYENKMKLQNMKFKNNEDIFHLKKN